MYGYIPQADVDLFVVLRSRISLREIKQNQKRQANNSLAKRIGRALGQLDAQRIKAQFASPAYAGAYAQALYA